MKSCNKCKKTKPLNEFKIARSNVDNRCSTCKECDKIRNKRYRDKKNDGIIDAF